MFTLIIPAFLRAEHETVPTFSTPALNDLWRFARFQVALRTRSQLYQTFLCDQLRQPENVVYASPVWQQMGMNSVNMLDGAAVAITADEARILCEGLNDLYAGDAVFQAARPDLWTLTLPEKVQWSAPCVLDICGQMDGSEQASGGNTAEWLRWSAEIQMWLHSHRLNENRQPPINAVWLWNAPEHTPVDFQAALLLGTDSVWAKNSSLQTEAAPYDWAAWLRVCDERKVAVAQSAVLADDFVACRDTGDVWAYVDLLADWETRWFAPLRDALFSGSLKGLRIVCEQGECVMVAKPQWAFWRRKKRFDGKYWG
ncbi:hypothetical protein MIS45_07635 [Wielerella bovis]|uniref:hypothetical protein n=1 Tax=Wielerella bovis TaxID=2917790 RepID=UPI00201941D0|nr:hypothetical protein [Wielerella bovis]ULJ68663.1 hypothetical protein MIS45_07635 [Wielerella bovis]